MSEAVDPVAEATQRLEAAVERLARIASSRPAPAAAPASAEGAGEAATPGVDPAAVAALAARLDETIARLRGVLGEEG